MTIANAAQAQVKTVADPNAAYESLRPIWNKCRAICNGERFVKDYDSVIDTTSFTNLLIPFSPSMSQQQFNFYKAEAELPGITAQFAKMLVGGLLRKKPTLTLPDSVPEEAYDWILNQIGQDDCSLTSFMDSALWEELQTSRAWVYIDYPAIPSDADLSKDEMAAYKPYPVLWNSDFVINWKINTKAQGKGILERVITYGLTESYEDNEFHPTYVETVWVHELDAIGKYQIRVFKRNDKATSVPVVNGFQVNNPGSKALFELEDTITDILMNGERLDFIPAWPLNGSIEPQIPVLTPVIDKEIALYNKISRRNHLLYGAATYTPVVFTELQDEEFDEIVSAGLGTWIKLHQDDRAEVLKTPTDALEDMDRTIAASIEEMAKLGIRMLSPETDQSGVALQLRNAAQTAQLGTLNNKVSATMSQVITFLLNWKYDLQLVPGDVIFSLSADFNPTPLGADWLRLATEWYQSGLIPRTIWLEILKHNDLLSPDYNDEEGQKQINADKDLLMMSVPTNTAFAAQMMSQLNGNKTRKEPDK